MNCPKCGVEIEDDVKTCPNCGIEINKEETNLNTDENAPIDNSTADGSKRIASIYNKAKGNGLLRIIYWVLALVVLIIFFCAAGSIAKGGEAISAIRSVGGKTMDEIFYKNLGPIYAGYAMISCALGIFFASILFWLGIKSKK